MDSIAKLTLAASLVGACAVIEKYTSPIGRMAFITAGITVGAIAAFPDIPAMSPTEYWSFFS